MSLEIKGKLHKIFAEQNVNDTFKKREFVIETDEKYPQLVKFELVQDKCDLIDPYKVGNEITVSFNLRGREWNEKYFTNLHAWKIEGAVDAHEPPANVSSGTINTDKIDSMDGEDFVLPF